MGSGTSVARYAHITLGKAGSQWVRDVLSDPDIFSLQKGLRLIPPFRGGEYGIAEFAKEPPGTFASPIFHVRYDGWKHFAAPEDRCITVLRDPRDSIVSWAFSLAYSHVTEEHVRIIRPTLLALDLRGKLEIAMYTFWESSAAQRSWAGKPETESELVLRYEEIVRDQRAAFRRMLDFYGWSVPEEVLLRVIDRLSFETRSGRKRGEKQEFSHYRNGVAGDWKNYFDRDLAQRFEEACPSLLVDLGYETSDRWWEACPERLDILSGGALDADGNAGELAQKCEILERQVKELTEAFDDAAHLAERLLGGHA
uniref:Sulfotransferase domain-containing protein n=1 Tax=mine drainage metagenome TaxID=410659 RepID=E6Q5U5_9ZZZZ